MRDPKRIKPFLDELEKLWKKYPDMRFFQLIDSIIICNGDLYYKEDDEALKIIKKIDFKL